MKAEQKQFYVVLETIVVCIIFAGLYAIAGSQDFWGGQKWLRRFLAPGLFCLWAFFRSGFDWRYLIQMGPMMGGLTLPYGADSLGMKWFLRGICGLVYGTSSSIVNFWHKRFLMGIYQIILAASMSIIAGVYNPFSDAMKEQFVIGLFIVLLPAFTVVNRNNLS